MPRSARKLAPCHTGFARCVVRRQTIRTPASLATRATGVLRRGGRRRGRGRFRAARDTVSGMEIWINPACSKCRSALTLLDAEGAEYTVRRYLEDVPSEDEIREVLDRLGLEPWDITRTQEAAAKELGVKEWARDAEFAGAVGRGAGGAPEAHPAADHHRGGRYGRGGAHGRRRTGRVVPECKMRIPQSV